MASATFTSQMSGALDIAQFRAATATANSAKANARKNAEDLEATFLNSMFQHMFTETEGEGPMGGGTGIGVWRSFMTDEFAKSFAKKGGIGLADPVYKSLLAQQEVAAQK